MSIKLPLPNSKNRETNTHAVYRSSASLVQSQTSALPLSNSRASPRLAAAAAGSALHALALPDRHCWLGVGGCGSHALLDLAGHGEESLLDVGGTLRGGLEEGDAEAVCELLLLVLDTARTRILM